MHMVQIPFIYLFVCLFVCSFICLYYSFFAEIITMKTYRFLTTHEGERNKEK